MQQEVTRLLEEWRDGDQSAADRLFPIVYDELRRLARSYMNQERKSHTLQPTALVNEAFIKLTDIERIQWQNRAHFFAVSATIMRRILVDHARKLASKKRGAGLKRLTLENLNANQENRQTDLLDLDEALNRLGEADERKARVLEMNYFGGLSQSHIAEVLKISPKTVQRDLEFARLWLFRELK